MAPRVKFGRVLSQWHNGWLKPTCCAWPIAPPGVAATSSLEVSPGDSAAASARAANRVIAWQGSFAEGAMIRKPPQTPRARREDLGLGADSEGVQAGWVDHSLFSPKKK